MLVVICEEIDNGVEINADINIDFFYNFSQIRPSAFSRLYNIRSVFSKAERIVDFLKIFTRILLKAAMKSSQLKLNILSWKNWLKAY